MVQAAVLGGQFFDPFSLFDDGGVASKVGVGWSYVADALVVALVVVVIDEGADLVFEIAGQIIIFKQDLRWSQKIGQGAKVYSTG